MPPWGQGAGTGPWGPSCRLEEPLEAIWSGLGELRGRVHLGVPPASGVGAPEGERSRLPGTEGPRSWGVPASARGEPRRQGPEPRSGSSRGAERSDPCPDARRRRNPWTRSPQPGRLASRGEARAHDPRVGRPRAFARALAGSSASLMGRAARAPAAAGVAGGHPKSGRRRLAPASFGQRDVAVAADDDVVEDRNADEIADAAEAGRELDVGPGWRRIARGVVMRDDDGRR